MFEREFAFFDLLEQNEVVFIPERRASTKENEESNRETPVITAMIIRLLLDDLRSDVARRSSSRSSKIVDGERAC